MMLGLQKILLLYALTCLGPNVCGNEIIHGEKVPEGSMQYMVSLQNSRSSHVCGGFLISEDFVLTAAHCDREEPTRVVVGTHDLEKANSDNIRHISKRYKDSSYVSEGHGRDIMLLKLSEKVRLDNGVNTIPLPTSNMHVNDNEQCSVAGWGQIKSIGVAVHELRMVDVSLINQRDCVRLWSRLPANVICAGGYGTKKGFCQGDSGGPLVCNGKAVGIVSFNRNLNCNYPTDVPNIYTEVSKYLDWINETIKNG